MQVGEPRFTASTATKSRARACARRPRPPRRPTREEVWTLGANACGALSGDVGASFYAPLEKLVDSPLAGGCEGDCWATAGLRGDDRLKILKGGCGEFGSRDW